MLYKVKTPSYEVKIFKGFDGLINLESNWRKLTDLQSDVPFYQRFEWYHAYLSHLEQLKEDVFFFLVVNNQEPIAIVPLRHQKRSQFGVRLSVWETPITNEIDLYDIVAKQKNIVIPAFYSVIQKLKSIKEFRFDAIWLSHVLEKGNASNLITDGFIKHKVFEMENYSKYLTCCKGEKSAVEFGTGKFRRNLRRLEKRLNEKGEVTYKCVQTIDENRDVFPMFLDVEASGWKGEDGTKSAIKYNENAKEFYNELVGSFGKLGKCRINFLQVNGNAIAAQYCLMDDDRINLLKIGHDPQYQDTSPGFLLIKKILEDECGNENFKELSFVTGAEWNDIFRPEKLGVFSVVVFNTTARGFLVFFLTSVKRTIKHWIRGNS
jgi:hypothetical protein